MSSILNFIKQTFSSTLYVCIWRDRLLVKDIDNGKVFDDIPLVAISDDEKKIIAVGKDAKNELNVVNPFDHPRTLLSDFTVGEKLLQHAYRYVFSNSYFKPAPLVYIHPMEKLEGGLTQIEARAFRELASGAGAREVYVCSGVQYTDEEIRSGHIKKMD
jgi:rod shape-determining protein MreB and related proteins